MRQFTVGISVIGCTKISVIGCTRFRITARNSDSAWNKAYKKFFRRYPEVIKHRLSIGGAVTPVA